VDKANQFIIGALFWRLVEQGKTFGAEPLHFGMDICHLEGDMVHAFSFLFHEFADDAIGPLALEQLDLCVAAPEKRGLDTFRGYSFRLIARAAQQAFVKRDGEGKVFYGNTDMFDFLHGARKMFRGNLGNFCGFVDLRRLLYIGQYREDHANQRNRWNEPAGGHRPVVVQLV
jgi:hypothetical protein